ncbi:hypothetical protein EV121DRAFT_182403, partial [Schizophyllum commune]
HAQLRNVIERIFGALKREFKMAAEACEYRIQVQCLIPLGLTLLHNFLRRHEPERYNREARIALHREPAFEPHGDAPDMDNMVGAEADTEDEQANLRREEIAQAMWTQYQATL